jgi:hypothetical protein
MAIIQGDKMEGKAEKYAETMANLKNSVSCPDAENSKW